MLFTKIVRMNMKLFTHTKQNLYTPLNLYQYLIRSISGLTLWWTAMNQLQLALNVSSTKTVILLNELSINNTFIYTQIPVRTVQSIWPNTAITCHLSIPQSDAHMLSAMADPKSPLPNSHDQDQHQTDYRI